ncbi:MAG: hypothetical protein ACUVRP_00215 [Chlorobiales bacterium]
MNNIKQDGKVQNERLVSPEKLPQTNNNNNLQAAAQRLFREQRDMARITTSGRRDE